jgi:hypothetical protein
VFLKFQAQVQYEASQRIEVAQEAIPFNPYVPNAPPPYPTSTTGDHMYPSLGDFMGLDITPEFIQTHIVSSKCFL